MLSASLIQIPSQLIWQPGAVFAISNGALVTNPRLSRSTVHHSRDACILAVDEQSLVCWMPETAARQDRLIYASALPHIKKHFDLRRTATACSTADLNDHISTITRPAMNEHEKRQYMSRNEIERMELRQLQEQERADLVKQHAENKTTEAARSGGFHSIRPRMTARAFSSMEDFKKSAPSHPQLARWIAIQISSMDTTADIELDIPVTKGIQLDKPLPIDKQKPGVYFLSFLAPNSVQPTVLTGQITWYPVDMSAKLKMIYASVTAYIVREFGKRAFNLVVDDGRDITFTDVLEELPAAPARSSLVPSPIQQFSKPVRPKMVSKSVFISPGNGPTTFTTSAPRVSPSKEVKRPATPVKDYIASFETPSPKGSPVVESKPMVEVEEAASATETIPTIRIASDEDTGAKANLEVEIPSTVSIDSFGFSPSSLTPDMKFLQIPDFERQMLAHGTLPTVKSPPLNRPMTFHFGTFDRGAAISEQEEEQEEEELILITKQELKRRPKSEQLRRYALDMVPEEDPQQLMQAKSVECAETIAGSQMSEATLASMFYD